ncbi:MAG: AMP-binding protein, partial [Acidimicrobiales bacterium]|nr:AMP-binding protein [Acidimicrobiales bacterium]
MYPGVHAAEKPDHPAVIMGRTGETQTYAELDERSSRLASFWASSGLQKGDHIALFMENQIRFMEVVWSALRSGLYVTAINSYLSAPEVAYIVDDCMAKAVVTSAARHAVASEVQALGETPAVDTWLLAGAEGAAPGFDDYEAAIAAADRFDPELETMGSTMLYSSGSTGRPKGILRALPGTHPSQPDARALGLVANYDYGPDMVYLSPAPMYHAAPLAFVTGAQRHGGTVVMM